MISIHRLKHLTYQSVEHLVEHRSQAPPVHGAVVRLLLENLRGQVLRRPTEGGRGAVGLYAFFAETEVRQHDVARRVQQDVLRLQVPVQDKEGRITQMHLRHYANSHLCAQLSTRGCCRIVLYLYTMCREWR